MPPLRSLLLLAAVPAALGAQARPTLTIGGEEDAGVELGSPLAIIEVRDRLVILESRTPFLRVLTTDGRLLQTLGRRGQGPGEYERPYAIMADADGRVRIADRNQRLTTYIVGDTLALGPMQRMPSYSMNACAAGRTVWLLRPDSTGMLHELHGDGPDLVEGRTVGSSEPFIPATQAMPVDFRRAVTSGALTCDDQTAWVPTWGYGDVRTIPLGGGPQRLVMIPGFEHRPFDPSKPKGVDFADTKLYDMVIGSARTPEGLLIAVAKGTGFDDAYESVRTYLLAATGPPALIPGSGWRAMAYTRSGIYCYKNDPVPLIQRFTATRCP